MRFDYRALNEEGKMLRGKIVAQNKTAAKKMLEEKHLKIIAIQFDFLAHFSTVNALKISEKAHFCFCLQQLLEAGVSLHDALLDLSQSVDFSPVLQNIFGNLLSFIESGASLSVALKTMPEHFSEVFVASIQAGEASGTLPFVLKSLYKSLIWQEHFRQQRNRLFVYPSFVALTLGLVFCFLMLFLVPQLKHFVYSMQFELPWYSQFLFNLSDFFKNHFWIIIFFFFIFIFLFYFIQKTFPIFYAQCLLKTPIFGKLLKKIALARFVPTASLLYSSGIPILQTLHFAQNVLGNKALEQECQQARLKINQGDLLSAAFRQTQFFTPFVIRMFAVGEKTGALDSALNHVHNFYTKEVSESVARLHVLIEPILTLILGALLAWVMLAVLEPIYQIVGQMV